MSRFTDQKWITLADARERIFVKPTEKALIRWIERWNDEHLDDLILRIPGMVEEHSLRHALKLMAQKHTPGIQRRKNILRGATAKRFHQKGENPR